jgi:hypothetical protein
MSAVLSLEEALEGTRMSQIGRFISYFGVLSIGIGCSGGKSGVDGTGQGGSGYIPESQGGQGIDVQQSSVTFSGSSLGDCRISVDGEACGGVAYEPEYTPLDIYVMFDQTGSMCSCVDPPLIGNPCPDPNCRKTRIEAIREAMSEFLADPNSADIGIGVGYFGQFPIGSANCQDASYTAPAVPIEALPNNGPAMMTSLNSVAPTGETPTGAAIRGGCSYAKSWKQAHPSRKVVMLLVTDGLPEAPVSCPTAGCCPTLSDAVSAAEGCLGKAPAIQTYVLGVGPYLDNLRQIAIAGGTNDAYLVGSGDVSAEVLHALNLIRGAASIPCSLKIPTPTSGRVVAYDQVNIAYANSSCQGTVFPYVETATSCGSNVGWYYDDLSAPTHVELCPTSCDQVSVAGSRLMFTVGCHTIDAPIVN